MAGLNKLRGSTQIQLGTVPAAALDTAFRASGGDLFVDKENHSAEVDGRTGFTCGATPVAGSEHVFLRGTLRIDGYTMAGSQIIFDAPPTPGDDLVVSYRKAI